ncbi:MAG TPA: MFS transporter, partial [Hyphomonadaceae bacterium]|nr:MFS transporter [Hyphomonadaceae bacterium]
MTDATLGRAPSQGWFGHPKQLAILFTSEMWERFGYYGMRALLVLYLVQHFVFSDNVAGGLYGAFTALVYLTPLIGGFIADNYLGPKKSVKLGAIFMSIGYLMLAFTGGQQAEPFVDIQGARYEIAVEKVGESQTQFLVDGDQRYQITGLEDGSIRLEGAQGAVPETVAAGGYAFGAERNGLAVLLLFVSLGLVSIGNGYFKPNISTMVGSLYEPGDRRRDSGFTIFYMGINTGSLISQFFGPLIVAITGSFQWGFAFAGFGMLLAWLRIELAGKALEGYGERPADAKNRDWLIYGASIAAIPVMWFLLNNAVVAAEAARAVAANGVFGYLASLPLLGKVMFLSFLVSMIAIP